VSKTDREKGIDFIMRINARVGHRSDYEHVAAVWDDLQPGTQANFLALYDKLLEDETEAKDDKAVFEKQKGIRVRKKGKISSNASRRNGG
jgi:hypothetical protein